MGTKDVRIDTRVNKFVWHHGVKAIPRRVRVRLARKRNEDEDAEAKVRARVLRTRARVCAHSLNAALPGVCACVCSCTPW